MCVIACITVWHNCGSIKDKKFTESKKKKEKGDGSVICSQFAIAQFGPLGAKCLPRVFGV
jgi:hypothetical protein